MSHHYQILPNHEAKFLKSITTQPQANKATGVVCASVTTKLNYAPKEFLELWFKKQIHHLTKKFPHATFDEINDMAWGMRLSPETNELIKSSDWGTALHKHLEDATEAHSESMGYRKAPWQGWIDLWTDWLKKNRAEVIGTEMLVSDSDRLVAGSIDQVLKVNGKVILADFKCRKVGDGDIKTKHYPKDTMQLAVEADIIRMKLDLDYMPRIYTVIMNTDEHQMFVKLWTEAAQAKALKKFDAVNTFYNDYNEL